MRRRLADFSRYLPFAAFVPVPRLLAHSFFPSFGCRMMDEDAHSHSLAGGVTNTGCARSLLRSLVLVLREEREKEGRAATKTCVVSSSYPNLDPPFSDAPEATAAPPRNERGGERGRRETLEKGPFRGALAVRYGRIHFISDGKTNYTLKEARSQRVDGILSA